MLEGPADLAPANAWLPRPGWILPLVVGCIWVGFTLGCADPGSGDGSSSGTQVAEVSVVDSDSLDTVSGSAGATSADSVETRSAPEAEDELPDGRWHRFRERRFESSLTAEQRKQIEQLQAIGYVQGSSPAPALSGVVRHDRARAFEGLNFYTSGHGCEAFLLDMDGRVLHRWGRSFEEIFSHEFPGGEVPAELRGIHHWRRARPLPQGDILVIWGGQAIARLDKDSNVIWARLNRAHHDLDITETGDIYVLTRTAHVLERIHPEDPVLEDFVVVLDADGREKRRLSVIEAFESSRDYNHIWTGSPARSGDIFHTNTVRVLDGSLAERIPAFAAGNLLISVRHLNVIAVVDLDAEEVVWASRGAFRRQHDPSVLPDGTLMLFDNRGPGGFSSVRVYDPVRMEMVWEYRGSADRPFFSKTNGTAQNLPNGNILITESDSGRAFEVTREKHIVWEFLSPHRAGDELELVATLFEVLRLSPEFPTGWATAP